VRFLNDHGMGKISILLCLIFVSTFNILLLKQSRSTCSFHPIQFVFIGEAIKLLLAVLMNRGYRSVGGIRLHLLFLPAVLYVLQNVLVIYAVTLLPLFIYNGLLFLRTLFSAVLGEVILGKPIGITQLADLVCLVFAAVIFGLPQEGTASNAVGVSLILIIVVLSSVAGALVQRFAEMQASDEAAISSQLFVLSAFGMVASGSSLFFIHNFSLWEWDTYTVAALFSHVLAGYMVALSLRSIGNVARQVAAVISTAFVGIFEAAFHGNPVFLHQVASFVVLIISMIRFAMHKEPPHVEAAHQFSVVRSLLFLLLMSVSVVAVLQFPLRINVRNLK